MARISIDVEVPDEVLDQLRLLIREELAALNVNGETEWLDASQAGIHLGRSKGAIERGWRRGTIPSVVSRDGRRRASRAMLDEYQANGSKS